MRRSARDRPNGFLSAEEMDRLGARVRLQLSGRLSDFGLRLGDGGLVLRGRAHTYYVKQLAQHAVMETTDVPILRNEIEVS